MNIGLICEFLDTYSGRDKILRTLSYATKLATVGTINKETEAKLKIFSSQMSGCRVVLRLMDDLPTLHSAVSYGWGKQETDWMIRWLDLLQIAVDIIFNPLEHICWAGEHKLIRINTVSWDNATTWFWIIALHLALFKSLRKLNQLKQCQIKQTDNSVNGQRQNELLISTRLILDISYAISYLPSGILWGGQMKTWQVGALGTVSSLIGLYQALSKMAKQKKDL